MRLRSEVVDSGSIADDSPLTSQIPAIWSEPDLSLADTPQLHGILGPQNLLHPRRDQPLLLPVDVRRIQPHLAHDTETQVLSCSTLDRPELGPRLFGRDFQLVDLPAVLLGELDKFVLGSLRGPAALALHPILHAATSSRAGY